jgi:hypothetical protein
MTKPEPRRKWPEVPFCEVKYCLIGDFIAARHELMELHNQQTHAVLDEDPDFSRFDDLIHMAREKKDETKYTLIAHVDKHHC